MGRDKDKSPAHRIQSKKEFSYTIKCLGGLEQID